MLICGTESGKGPRCYVRVLPDGDLRPVTPEGTEDGSVSPDGQTVVARRPGVGWFEYSLTGGEERPRFERSTGRRTLVRQLAVGRTAFTSLFNVVISADEESYAYTYDRSLSVLYAVAGVR